MNVAVLDCIKWSYELLLIGDVHFIVIFLSFLHWKGELTLANFQLLTGCCTLFVM